MRRQGAVASWQTGGAEHRRLHTGSSGSAAALPHGCGLSWLCVNPPYCPDGGNLAPMPEQSHPGRAAMCARPSISVRSAWYPVTRLQVQDLLGNHRCAKATNRV